MSIFRRMFRIGKANVNSALDKMEDPVKMIEQILRELEDDVAKVTAAVTTQMAVEKRFERELKDAEALVERRDQQARQALANGEEELAREALVDKNRHVEKRDKARASYESAKANSERLRQQLSEMKSKVQDMKAQKSTLIAQAEAAKATKKINQTMSGANTDSLTNSFARMEEKVQQMHDEAQAAQELANEGKSFDDKFEEMVKSTASKDIDDELAALKAELNKE
ncbi:PspA/IM30 family protein [Bacillus horti]|uniref:Phage shock protein A n=1 Tax=Caldalkalibacillus horti TaxID=77523 RepID=A0ABT9VYE1_9BACI|nr:PspA/IM30 family protein [Bacillus horti]MDQ0165630.1 phage shock protein A [Bacillus horti]